MNKEGLEQQASLYVLDLLEEGERAAFEELLVDSPDLKRLVRELRKGVFEEARSNSDPIRMDLLENIHTRLDLELPGENELEEADQPSPIPWSQVWAIAAVIFLGLNLMLLFKLSNQSATGMGESLASGESSDESGVPADASGEDPALTDSGHLLAQIERLRNALSAKEEDLQSNEETLAALESENMEIKSFNAGWQREYTRLAAKMLPFFESNDGMSRFTVIEMVDDESYRLHLPGRGFAELAGSFLIGEGNIAGVDDIGFVGPVAAGTGVQATTGGATTPGLTPSIRGDNDTVAGVLPGENSSPGTSFGSEAVDSPELLDTGDPAGFTVWRDDEQKGFLDIYNLPLPSDGESPFLWVRSSELEPYLPVGFLPELENGTGSLFYEVEESNFTPTEILITSEQDGGIGGAPSGNILLRGP